MKDENIGGSQGIDCTRASLDAIKVSTDDNDTVGVATRVLSQKVHRLGLRLLGPILNNQLMVQDAEKSEARARTKQRARCARWTQTRGPCQAHTKRKGLDEDPVMLKTLFI